MNEYLMDITNRDPPHGEARKGHGTKVGVTTTTIAIDEGISNESMTRMVKHLYVVLKGNSLHKVEHESGFMVCS